MGAEVGGSESVDDKHFIRSQEPLASTLSWPSPPRCRCQHREWMVAKPVTCTVARQKSASIQLFWPARTALPRPAPTTHTHNLRLGAQEVPLCLLDLELVRLPQSLQLHELRGVQVGLQKHLRGSKGGAAAQRRGQEVLSLCCQPLRACMGL